MRNEERILVLVYQPSVDGISTLLTFLTGSFFSPRLLLFGIKAKNKIKLCAHKFSWTQRSFVSIFVLFLRNSFVNSFSLLFVVVVGWDHSDGTHSLRLIVGNRSLKLLHFSPARTLISTLGLGKRQNKRTEKGKCVNYSRKLKISPWWTADESCAPHWRTKIVCNGNSTQKKDQLLFLMSGQFQFDPLIAYEIR